MDAVTSIVGVGGLVTFGSAVYCLIPYAALRRLASQRRASSINRLEISKGNGNQAVQLIAKLKRAISRVKLRLGSSGQQQESFEHSLVECSDALSDALGSGKSLTQGLSELPAPKNKELETLFRTMSNRIAYGESPEQVFKEVSATSESPAFKTLGTAISVHYGAGGNLRELLSEFSDQQREQLLFRQSLKTQTAQGRLSVKLVGLVPPILLGVIGVVMPGYLDVFFISPSGRLMLGTALLLDAIGFFLVFRLMRVPV